MTGNASLRTEPAGSAPKSLRTEPAGSAPKSLRTEPAGSAPKSLRTAQLRLGGLAVVSLVAGSLPWIMGGPLVAQLLGIPFLLVGLFCAFATYRLPAVAAAAAGQSAAYPAEPAGCGCGGCGCCADTDETGSRAAGASLSDVPTGTP